MVLIRQDRSRCNKATGEYLTVCFDWSPHKYHYGHLLQTNSSLAAGYGRSKCQFFWKQTDSVSRGSLCYFTIERAKSDLRSVVKRQLCWLTDTETSSVESDHLAPCRPPLGCMTARREMFALALFQFYYDIYTESLCLQGKAGGREWICRKKATAVNYTVCLLSLQLEKHFQNTAYSQDGMQREEQISTWKQSNLGCWLYAKAHLMPVAHRDRQQPSPSSVKGGHTGRWSACSWVPARCNAQLVQNKQIKLAAARRHAASRLASPLKFWHSHHRPCFIVVSNSGISQINSDLHLDTVIYCRVQF